MYSGGDILDVQWWGYTGCTVVRIYWCTVVGIYWMYNGGDILDVQWWGYTGCTVVDQLTVVHSSHGTSYLLTNISKRSTSPLEHTECSIVAPNYK